MLSSYRLGVFGLVTAALVLAILGPGCTVDEIQGTAKDNQAPQVWVAAAPPEGSVTQYRVRLWWGGWDPDGEISHYEYIITDNDGGLFDPADTISTATDYKWKPLFRADSTFTLAADEIPDSSKVDWETMRPEEFQRSHTFFIRAIDDRGKRSNVAYRSFTARTLSPTVYITVPFTKRWYAAVVPPITTFKWQATDYATSKIDIQDPDSVRTILIPTVRFDGDHFRTLDYIRRSPRAPEWTPWRYYRTAGDSGKVWTTPKLSFGSWLFAVQVKDDAGAVNPTFDIDRNVRLIAVRDKRTGPILTVRNRFAGSIVSSSPDTPVTILDIPSGLPIRFEWSADASAYGGLVSGYRYGWDIKDFSQADQWEISYTPFVGSTAASPARQFFEGTHIFYVEVVDNSEFTSRIGVLLNIVPFTMTRNLLLVDDWDAGTYDGWIGTNGTLPSDEEHDEFWIDMLSDVAGFYPGSDMVHIGPGQLTLPVAKLADYKTLIWSAQGNHTSEPVSYLADVIRFRDPTSPVTGKKVEPNIVETFLEVGGKVMLCGDRIMTGVIDRDIFEHNANPSRPPVFPLIFRYELNGDQDGEYTGKGNKVGQFGVGETSFAYRECCLNVLDVAVNQTPIAVRRPPLQRVGPGGCAVDHLRSFSYQTEGLRAAIPLDGTYTFPRLELRREASGSHRFYEYNGINTDIYNPPYFHYEAGCANVAEIIPSRDCFEPIYGLECNDRESPVFGAPVGFWTSVFEDRVPEYGGSGARSVVWGFHPIYFKPEQVREALGIILFEEWKLPPAVR